MALKLNKADFDELRRHGEETYPHECCGVLVGEAGDAGSRTVLAVIRCGNTRTDSPQNRYNIDVRDLIRIQREVSTGGPGYRRLLSLPPGPPRAMVYHRSFGRSLAAVFLCNHQHRKWKGRPHQFISVAGRRGYEAF